MFGKIGMTELIVVLVVALVIFGPSKLPALGKMAGKAIGTLRHYTDSNNWEELLDEEAEEEEAAKAGKKQKAEAAKEPAADQAEQAGEAPADKPSEAPADQSAQEQPEEKEETREQAS